MDIAVRANGFVRNSSNWIFQETNATRDPRLDFMRGFVFLILFVCHFDYFSLFTYFAWERIGVVSSAETFVSLAGIVTGIVFGKKLKQEGLAACMPGLINRAIDIYKINIIVTLTIGLLQYVPWIDTTVLTTFYNPYTGVRYPLYPPVEAGVLKLIRDALLLQCGPHQFQVMGLYSVLFLLSPVIFYMIEKQRVVMLSAISVALYIINLGTPETTVGTAEIRLTGAQFEFGFPLIAWQVLFVHSLLAGFYKNEIMQFFYDRRHAWLVWGALIMSAGFMLFTLNHPIDTFPSWMQLSFVPADRFNDIYNTYFAKYRLGPGRLLNEVVLFIAVFAVLTRFWQPIHKSCGWFFIPLGQASLYVFFVHVFLLLAVANTPLPGMMSITVNTLIHAVSLGLAWLMVTNRFLFRWIPH